MKIRAGEREREREMNTTFYEGCKAAPAKHGHSLASRGIEGSVRNSTDPKHTVMLIRTELCVFVFRRVRMLKFNTEINSCQR